MTQLQADNLRAAAALLRAGYADDARAVAASTGDIAAPMLRLLRAGEPMRAVRAMEEAAQAVPPVLRHPEMHEAAGGPSVAASVAYGDAA